MNIFYRLWDYLRSSSLSRWKARRKHRRAEQSFLRHLESVAVPASLDNASARKVRGAPLRRLLFIADLMWEQEELIPELKRICEVDVLDVRFCLKESSVPPSEAISQQIRTSSVGEPDAILLYLRPEILDEQVFEAIRKRWNCPILGMNLDDRVQFHPHGVLAAGRDNYGRWARKFDLHLTSCRIAVEWYREAGSEARFMPQGFCRKERFRNPPQIGTYAHQLSFAGSWKPERARLVNGLFQAGHKVDVFGRNWPDSAWADDLPTLFRASQINLGIGYIFSSAGITCLKGRDTECPATGACYLTTWHWELPELFDVGKEILCYRNLEELLEILTYYLPRPEACHRIAVAAHQRAWRDHAWEYRMRKAFRDFGFHI